MSETPSQSGAEVCNARFRIVDTQVGLVAPLGGSEACGTAVLMCKDERCTRLNRGWKVSEDLFGDYEVVEIDRLLRTRARETILPYVCGVWSANESSRFGDDRIPDEILPENLRRQPTTQ